MSEPILNLLLVDDEDSVREPLARHLRAEPYNYMVKDVANFEDALQALEETKDRFDVALIDEVLGEGLGGLDLLRQIKTIYPQIECILFTGWGMQSGLEALRAGTYRYFAKPFNLEELALTIRFAADKKRIRREREYLSTLVQVSRELTQTTDIEKQLALVWNFVQDRLATATFFIALYDSKTDTLRFPLSFDEGKPDPLPDRHLGDDPSGWGVAGHVVKNRREQVWFSLKQSEQEWQALGIMPQISGKGPSETGICIPLQVGGKILGALSAQSYQPQAFDLAFLDAIRTLGSHVAPAIENARLFSNLERTRNHLEGLIASSLDAIISIDKDKHVTVFNKQADEMFGYTADEMIGQNVAILHQDIGEAVRIWDVVHSQGKIVHHEVALKHKNGTKIPAILSAMSIKDTEGNEIGQAGFLHARLVEDQLRALIQASQAISGTLEVDKVLQRIIESALVAFSTAEKGSIHLYDERIGMLVMEAYKGYSLEIAKAVTFKPGEGRSGWVYEHNEPLVVGNVQENELSKQVDSMIAYKEVSEQKSTICVPLRIKGKVIGTLSLDNVTFYNAFHNSDIELLSTFADQAAIAIDNARLFQEAKVAQEKIRASFEASNALVSSQPTKQLLEEIIRQAQKAAGASWVSVVLMDELGFARNLYTTGSDNKVDIEKVVRPDGITMQVMRTGRFEKIEDTNQQLNRVNPRMFYNKVAAALCVPFSVQGKQIGVVWIHYNEPRHFSDHEIEAIHLFVNQAAVAFDSARRMEELGHMRKAVEAMTSALEPSQVLQQVVESASEVLQSDSSTIWSYDNVRNQFITEELVAHGISPIDLESFRKNKPKKDGTARTVMEQGWIGISDISDSKYNFMGPSTVELLKSIGAKSFQGVALKVSNEELGVLYANYNRPRRFTDEDRRTLETFAYHAALALKKARLLEQVGKARDVAKVVAQVSVLEDLKYTLNSIVRGTQDALHCDVVTLYTYDQDQDEFSFPPTMVGVEKKTGVLKLGRVADQSVIRNILALEEAHVAEDASSDSLMQGPFVIRENIKSSVGIPLQVGDRKVGVMFVNYRSHHRFTTDESTNIVLFANQAAVAIRNAQLHSETKKRAETLAGLYKAGKAITSTLAVNEVLTRIAEQALHIVGTDSQKGCFSHVALLDGDILRFVAGFPLEIIDDLKQNVGEINLQRDTQKGIAGLAVITGQSKNELDVSNDPNWIPLRENINIHSQLSVPLKIGEQIIGVLSIEHPQPAVFGEGDVKNVESLAAQAAVAIENARLYNAAKQRTNNLDAILRISQTAISSLELAHILNATCRAAVELLKVDHSGLVLFDQALTIGKVLAEYPKLGAAGVDFPLHGVPVEERLIATKKPIMVPNVASEPGFDPVRDILTKLGTCSILIVPIVSKGKILGSFGLDVLTHQRIFTDEEIDLCTIFAAQVSVAIENAQQYEELRTMKALVGPRTATEWMRMVSMAWGHAIKRESGLGLRYLELIRQELEAEDTAKAKQDLTSLGFVIERIKDIPIVAPLAKEDKIISIFVNDLIRKHVDRMWQHEPYLFAELIWNLQPDLDNIAPVIASPQWVLRCLEIFIDNSINAMLDANSSPRRIEIATRVSENEVQILVTDTGPGFPPHLRNGTIGIDPVQKLEGSRGAGLGLVLAKNIAQTYGGDIHVINTCSDGTTMAISLPVERL
ncbi:MAG TPA: GAF domain-containing protein [Candidatus Hydrogenedentes bacterium]|nr:GAF domain-containing protein [Candidatus Hydrogenedentota bacterium]